MKPIRIIVTGGTIDAAEYNFAEGKVISFGDPAVESILKIGRVRHVYTKTSVPFSNDADILVLPQKDSLEMTDEDRSQILSLCLRDTRERILITHGTDTATLTGKLLAEHIKDKTIVITCAMLPNTAKETDARFNVGGAMIACSILPHGVYLVMQGEVFPINEVQKIKVASGGYFERTTPD